MLPVYCYPFSIVEGTIFAEMIKVIRSRRKTISLIILPDGSLEIRAPLHTTEHQIRRLLEEKADWIRTRRALAERLRPKPRQYVRGENFLFLGNSHKLEFCESSRQPLTLDGVFILKRSCLPHAQTIFTNWYKDQARRVISERAAWFSSHTGIQFTRLKITSARTRWGSCSSSGTLSFTWRLVMAPLPVIDYVVVHELAHILEHNHSSAFWNKVAAILPDYKDRLEWLNKNGHSLSL